MMVTQEFKSLSQRMLVQAAHRLGGVAELAAHLCVSETALDAWVAGREATPTEVVLKAIDVLLDAPYNSRPRYSPASPSP
jgi:hypothetical protein